MGMCRGAGEVEWYRLYITRWWGRNAVGKPWSTTYMLSSDPITVEVSINGKKLGMEVDTGPAVSLVPETVQAALVLPSASALISEVKDILEHHWR